MCSLTPSEILSESLEASAAEVVAAVKAQVLEGVIAKRRSSRYEPGKRSDAWMKMRFNQGRSRSSAAMSPLVAISTHGGRLLEVASRNGI